MMKVNLGATSLTSTPGDIGCYGLYYQWGRKDPFIGKASPTATANESTAFKDQTAKTTNAPGYEWKAGNIPGNTNDAKLASLIALPTTFASTSYTLIGDWITSVQNAGYDNLWGNPYETGGYPNRSPGSKSIYDPCPAGWRVPRADTWTMFTVSGSSVTRPQDINATDFWEGGWDFYCTDTFSGPTAFYPAAGSRHLPNGCIVNQISGHYWSSSQHMYYAAGMGFSELKAAVTIPNFGGAGYYMERRASGNSVRCAREE